ncbi:hypothetical protein [Hymenobacter ruricola]|uniref:Alginate export domain-containing protein n=1 Tax=Hymenobacter ruricola TaxID=2791023 RepID=A0ABS0I9J3_9BACT|nr:hypothetical protein [Hymenobacter ruricola]MBF9223647.1 hypothetical protein [Hymenobacter ruricola]
MVLLNRLLLIAFLSAAPLLSVLAQTHEHMDMAMPKPAQPRPAAPQPTPAPKKAVPAAARPASSATPVPAADTSYHAGRQHSMEGMDMPVPTAPQPTAPMNHAGHPESMKMEGTTHDMGGMNMAHGSTMAMPGMSHALSRRLQMSRNGSGTSWHPDATPMYMWMQHRGPWMLMYHGAAFGRYTSQNVNHNNARGHANAIDGPNWGMVMAQREIGARGLLNLSLMVSLDPLTETNGGYPLLFQTGESYQGQPLIDKQHPHDLISGLTASYTHAVSEDVDVSLYVGYPGEPAIGPVAFMHRISAMPNPDAPLSHHWTDATHITFGVATLGVRYKQFKLEGSNFTGREPDEKRYDFDRPRADSWAGRLNWNPSRSLALQVSRAFIKSPEDLHPGEDVTRTTASVLHSRTWGERRYLASALVWGLNEHGDGHRGEHAVLAETNLTLGRPTFYGRYEFVQKDSEELEFYAAGSSDNLVRSVYNIHALTLGSSYRLASLGGPRGPELSVGGQLTGYFIPQSLRVGQYGATYAGPGYGKMPLSASVYLRLTAPWMKMKM